MPTPMVPVEIYTLFFLGFFCCQISHGHLEALDRTVFALISALFLGWLLPLVWVSSQVFAYAIAITYLLTVFTFVLRRIIQYGKIAKGKLYYEVVVEGKTTVYIRDSIALFFQRGMERLPYLYMAWVVLMVLYSIGFLVLIHWFSHGFGIGERIGYYCAACAGHLLLVFATTVVMCARVGYRMPIVGHLLGFVVLKTPIEVEKWRGLYVLNFLARFVFIYTSILMGFAVFEHVLNLDQEIAALISLGLYALQTVLLLLGVALYLAYYRRRSLGSKKKGENYKKLLGAGEIEISTVGDIDDDEDEDSFMITGSNLNKDDFENVELVEIK